MRNDLKILWVEDTPKWMNEQREVLEMHIEDFGVLCDIECETDGANILQKIENESVGFKTFDIFLIDYSLSNNILGNSIIEKLRKSNIDSDILFYSSDNENDIRKIIKEDISAFEGVYVSNRESFMDKCLQLVEKNSKNLRSLSSIRGTLMDKTSENDFIVNSYLIKNYETLPDEQKIDITNMILTFIKELYVKQNSSFSTNIEKIDNNKPLSNMNKFLKLPSYIIPLELKYMIFEKIITFKGCHVFDDNTIENYLNNVVTNRNTLAHKKLDICKQQKFLQYYDNINQYNDRNCGSDCDNHTDDFKISLEEWDKIRKQVVTYAKCYDILLKELLEE